MVDFLNNFSNSCSHRLFTFDRKISKIEAELRLLEIKLNSIPGFEDEKPQAVTPVEPQLLQTVEERTMFQKPDGVEAESANDPESPPERNPALAKYEKMVQVGVPVPAVKLKMQAEGLDPDLLKM